MRVRIEIFARRDVALEVCEVGGRCVGLRVEHDIDGHSSGIVGRGAILSEVSAHPRRGCRKVRPIENEISHVFTLSPFRGSHPIRASGYRSVPDTAQSIGHRSGASWLRSLSAERRSSGGIPAKPSHKSMHPDGCRFFGGRPRDQQFHPPVGLRMKLREASRCGKEKLSEKWLLTANCAAKPP